MFFPERVVNIKPNERVLEIGPGATPHPRSDVLLEKTYYNNEEYNAQLGYDGKLNTNKQIVFYKGDVFPFKDKEFDYVICSHVLEHVDDVEHFLSEIVRVAKKGYFEFPTIYYEYLYNFSVHKMFLLWKNNTIYWMPKAESDLDKFFEVHAFFYQSLKMEYFCLIDALRTYFVQGFEWENEIFNKKVSTINDLCYDRSFIELIPRVQPKPVQPTQNHSLIWRVKNKIKRNIRNLAKI